MDTLLRQTWTSLRLNFRNRMAMIYGYVFPLIFLFAFWAIYRHHQVPLALHMGEILTVGALGGACFGLPTQLVSERERGVWRRYRLTPLPVSGFVTGAFITRYLLLLSAALLQIAVGLIAGAPLPGHPFGLFIAFSATAIAFLGLGMVIAMLADTVPAVQGLGQCIFLPMLMIGGVAVPLASLPDWAQHVAAFFPGRYAVAALQANITGRGLGGVWFDIAALIAIGAAGGIAAAKMFRWDTRQRTSERGSKAWLTLALGMWVLVGVVTELRGEAVLAEDTQEEGATQDSGKVEDYAGLAKGPATWQAVTAQDIDRIAFDRLPKDTGLVAPFAGPAEVPDDIIAAQLDKIRTGLAVWPPAGVADPVQRIRNFLAIAAVPDVLQMQPLERFVPAVVLEQLRIRNSDADLRKILCWIALHPEQGDESAVRQLGPFGLPEITGPVADMRGRIMLYAFKMLERVK